jgi:4-hydroxy-L-threonine phosphate dehydrogenase PdxA
MADCSAIKAQLDEANRAYDSISNGAQVVVIVDAFRSRVEYGRANMPELKVKIALLEAQYAACLAGKPRAVMTRPIQFWF